MTGKFKPAIFYFMNLPFFFEPNVAPQYKHAMLSEETSKHCIQVLRMKTHEKIKLTDGKGNLFIASIAKEDKRNCEVVLETSEFIPPPERKISIGISLLKNTNRFEWFLEKSTELGIQEIIPLICKRTEKQHFKQERAENILISAMLQSRQAWLPKLFSPTNVSEIIRSSSYSQRLIAHCETRPKSAFGEFDLQDEVQVLIGPEGDFTSEEIAEAVKNNYMETSLGENRLRTETAGIVAAVLMRTN
jgi:16S rRNA (uracil1498-N3)-methyltransferase